MSSVGLLTGERRLPGLRFEAQPPPLGDVLPRMDVAVFVGFASSGPINQPVVIEDSAQFTEIFGEDALLAWDAERGLMMRAYLGPTVRDFFRQGGRRCWIIRVARDAKYNLFPIPSLLERTANGDLFPAFARARSEGSWSDALRVGAISRSRPIEVTRASFAENKFELSPNSPADVQEGDLLRFTLRNEGYGLFAVVESVHALEQDLTSPLSEDLRRQFLRRRTLKVQCSKPLWFSTLPQTTEVLGRMVLPQPSQTLIFNNKVDGKVIQLAEPPTLEAGRIRVNCLLSLADAPPPGTLMRMDFETGQWWLTVQNVTSIHGANELSATELVQIEGAGFSPLAGQPVLSSETQVEAERLNFDLLVQVTGDKPSRLSDLGFDERHRRYWGAWPTDAQRYEEMTTLSFSVGANANVSGTREVFSVAARRHNSSSDQPTSTPQKKSDREHYLPVAMPFLTEAFLGAIEQPQSALERDGIALLDEHERVKAAFGSDLFLDSSMTDTNLENLLSQADYLRYHGPKRRRLKGIYAALDIEEASIIAVPDAVHRDWTLKPQELVRPKASNPLPHPKWWRYLDCNPPPNKILRWQINPPWRTFLIAICVISLRPI